MAILYAREQDLDAAEFCRVLDESGLGALRPLSDLDRLSAMIAGANIIVTARRDEPGGPLLGVARAITDFSWCCYLSELAVARSAQGLGVGKGLIDETRRLIGPTVSLMLASVPESVGFYERIGMPRMPDAYCYRRER